MNKLNIRKKNTENVNRGCDCAFIPTITGDNCESLIGDIGSNARCIGDYLICNTGNYCGNITGGKPGERQIPPGAICSPVNYTRGENSYTPVETLVGPALFGINTDITPK